MAIIIRLRGSEPPPANAPKGKAKNIILGGSHILTIVRGAAK